MIDPRIPAIIAREVDRSAWVARKAEWGREQTPRGLKLLLWALIAEIVVGVVLLAAWVWLLREIGNGRVW